MNKRKNINCGEGVMINFIEKVIKSSINNLYKFQPSIEKFTSETGHTEWNLAHHLANEMHKYLFWLDCDLEVTKHSSNNRRPDIIFHIRGNHYYNFIVVELKKDDKAGFYDDILKVKSFWFNEPLLYRYGITINLKGNGNFDACICKKSEIHEFTFEKDFIGMEINRNNKGLTNMTNEIRKLSDYSIEKSKIDDMIKKIDKLIYELYDFSEEETVKL